MNEGIFGKIFSPISNSIQEENYEKLKRDLIISNDANQLFQNYVFNQFNKGNINIIFKSYDKYYDKMKYKIQKELIEEDISNLGKLKDRMLLHPKIQKEYAKDIEVSDLGLF